MYAYITCIYTSHACHVCMYSGTSTEGDGGSVSLKTGTGAEGLHSKVTVDGGFVAIGSGSSGVSVATTAAGSARTVSGSIVLSSGHVKSSGDVSLSSGNASKDKCGRVMLPSSSSRGEGGTVSAVVDSANESGGEVTVHDGQIKIKHKCFTCDSLSLLLDWEFECTGSCMLH